MEQHRVATATRRTIVAGIAATLAQGPAFAQTQRDGTRRLGVLMPGISDDPLIGQAYAAALIQGLAALNWREGDNLQIDWRWARADPALFDRYAAELVALGPEVLLGASSPAVGALRRQTPSLPIVFTGMVDPVGQGFVTSLAHPGGTITGFSNFDLPMAGKWLALLTQITPPVARVAILYNPDTDAAASAGMLHAVHEAAPSLALAMWDEPCRNDGEMEAAVTEFAREERAGLLILPGPFTNAHRDAVIELAARHRLPAVYAFPFFASAGGLMSYGIDQTDLFRRSAAYIDRILKGAKPADLPVQTPTKYQLVINLKTAKALGVTIAPALLATADEVIE